MAYHITKNEMATEMNERVSMATEMAGGYSKRAAPEANEPIMPIKGWLEQLQKASSQQSELISLLFDKLDVVMRPNATDTMGPAPTLRENSSYLSIEMQSTLSDMHRKNRQLEEILHRLDL